jgi:hypothetical protein
MCHIVTEATDKHVPGGKATDHIDNTCGNLAGESGELGYQAMYYKETEKGVRDRLTEETKFRDETAETRTVLYN